jgi:dTDP-4-dehydrorhamnose reductase
MAIVVTGANGKLGQYLLSEGAQSGQPLVAWMRRPGASNWGHAERHLELLEAESWSRALCQDKPVALIHCAAMPSVDGCLREPELAWRVNVELTDRLAEQCQRRSVRFVYVSSDMVFDGESAPYAEGALVAPLSYYGKTKAAGEQAALKHGGWVARVALMVGPALGHYQSHYDLTLERLRRDETVESFQDEWRGILSFRDAARGLLKLAQLPPERRLLHLAGARRSRYEMSRLMAGLLGKPERVRASSRLDFPSPEPRARDLTLNCQETRQVLGWQPQPLEDQLRTWLA